MRGANPSSFLLNPCTVSPLCLTLPFHALCTEDAPKGKELWKSLLPEEAAAHEAKVGKDRDGKDNLLENCARG